MSALSSSLHDAKEYGGATSPSATPSSSSLLYNPSLVDPEAVEAAVAAAAQFAAAQQQQQQASSNSSNVHDTTTTEKDDNDDAHHRLARSRLRNREHARKTRLRKKAQLSKLQAQVARLQQERRTLRQSLEDCSMASILIGFSTNNNDSNEADQYKKDNHGKNQQIASLLVDATQSEQQEAEQNNVPSNKRKRLVSVDLSCDASSEPNEASSQQLQHPPTTSTTTHSFSVQVNGKQLLVGGSQGVHINWKSGVYTDGQGQRQQLSQEQLEGLRRERNRMHAKMTRDRKRCFLSQLERTIQDLQQTNAKMKDVLEKVTRNHFQSTLVLPGLTTTASSMGAVPPVSPTLPPATACPKAQDEDDDMWDASPGEPNKHHAPLVSPNGGQD